MRACLRAAEPVRRDLRRAPAARGDHLHEHLAGSVAPEVHSRQAHRAPSRGIGAHGARGAMLQRWRSYCCVVACRMVHATLTNSPRHRRRCVRCSSEAWRGRGVLGCWLLARSLLRRDSMQHATCNMQHATGCMQHQPGSCSATWFMQQAACIVQMCRCSAISMRDAGMSAVAGSTRRPTIRRRRLQRGRCVRAHVCARVCVRALVCVRVCVCVRAWCVCLCVRLILRVRLCVCVRA